jgi:organic radical activating enzyme
VGMSNWRVVPICDYQKLDVRPDDLLNNGLFRKCETYRGGGGYDQFPAICEKRLGKRAHAQFIVQLYGCNLDCPYCYVTRSGVWGQSIEQSTQQLVAAFQDSGQEVFHLMGGAPALYLDQWPELMEQLPARAVFHSDFLLTERPYEPETLKKVATFPNALFAVDIKGTTAEDYEKNTRKPFKASLFWNNLKALVEAKINFYITYTNPEEKFRPAFEYKMKYHFGSDILNDSFVIPLIDYDATPFVDILPSL